MKHSPYAPPTQSEPPITPITPIKPTSEALWQPSLELVKAARETQSVRNQQREKKRTL